MIKTKLPKSPFAVIGAHEWVSFPDLGGFRVKAKTDTGALTSAIHAWKIKLFEKDDAQWVSFEIHPDKSNSKEIINCEAAVSTIKTVKSSNGQREKRYTIKTTAEIGPYHYPIDLTLTNRDEMGYRMLLGRAAIKGRFLVDCAHSYIQTYKQ